MKQLLREIVKEWWERELPQVISRSINLQEYTLEEEKSPLLLEPVKNLTVITY